MTPFHPADDAGHPLAFHGGRLDEAARLYPHAPRPWIDLSTGINPHPWPVASMAAPDLHALPSDAALAALRAAAAGFFGASDLPIAALPGSEVGLRLLATLDLPRPWRVVTPGYRSHAAALPGATGMPIEALDEEAARGGTILFANPGNPDGRWLSPEAVVAAARRLRERGGMLVVDEAFADAAAGVGAGASVLPLVTADDAVMVLRSFGKFFGLAGVRLGFVAGHKPTVAAIADRLGSWPVSATAIAAGTAAYADAAWIDAMRMRLADEAAALDRVLADHGLAARGACPLFRLVETPRAGALFAAAAAAGILLRPFDYAPHWLRLGLPRDAAAMDRLAGVLRG